MLNPSCDDGQVQGSVFGQGESTISDPIMQDGTNMRSGSDYQVIIYFFTALNLFSYTFSTRGGAGRSEELVSARQKIW